MDGRATSFTTVWWTDLRQTSLMQRSAQTPVLCDVNAHVSELEGAKRSIVKQAPKSLHCKQLCSLLMKVNSCSNTQFGSRFTVERKWLKTIICDTLCYSFLHPLTICVVLDGILGITNKWGISAFFFFLHLPTQLIGLIGKLISKVHF